MSDQPDNVAGDSPPETAPTLASLDQRVRRLEDTVAVMQDTTHVEERVVERLTGQLSRALPGVARSAGGLIIDASRHLLAPPSSPPLTVAGANAGPPPYRPAPRRWFLWDLVAEARAMVYMFLDPRYKLGWPVRLATLGLLAAIFFSTLWLPGMALLKDLFIGTLVDKVVDLVLAYVLFKFLSREAQRYRETAPDLPPNLRP